MRRSVVVLVCVARAASAQPGDGSAVDPHQDQAQALYAEGARHYTLREYPQAIDAFKHAYALFPEPTFLFDIAQAYRLLGDCDNAAGFYRNYIHAKPDADDRDQADKLATDMEACAADQRKQRDAERARQLAAPPRVVTTAPSESGLELAGMLTAGVGAALTGAGVYFSVDAADKAHQLETACMTRCNAGDVASIDSQGKSSQTTAAVLYVSGGIALAAGAGMIVWATLHSSPETITVAPTRGGAAASYTMRF
ncbi:MAG: tetratricopeptide repeat protein [Acidobacteriota bacterium]